MEGGTTAHAAVVASERADAAIAAAMVAIAAASPGSPVNPPRAVDIKSPRTEFSQRTDFSRRSETTPRATSFLPYCREGTAAVESAADRAVGPASSLAASVAACESGDGTAATTNSVAASTPTPELSVEEQWVAGTVATALSTQASALAGGSVDDGAAAVPASLAASATPEYSMDDDGSSHASTAARNEFPDDGLITEVSSALHEVRVCQGQGSMRPSLCAAWQPLGVLRDGFTVAALQSLLVCAQFWVRSVSRRLEFRISPVCYFMCSN